MDLKGKYIRRLDQGFIGLVDWMGSDEDIEQAARVSYQKGTRKVNETRGLIRYCLNHRHTSIFEQSVMKLHVKAPIFVFRQWHRHRTWSYNELSGRYSVLPDECQAIAPNKWRSQSTTNKQGSGGYVNEWPKDAHFVETKNGPTMVCSKESLLDEDVKVYGYADESPGDALTRDEQNLQAYAREVYEKRLALGVAKEQARKDVPVSQYSEMFATVDLHNLLHFNGLRADAHAQEEIRVYADAICFFISQLFPITWEAWLDYVWGGVHFSRMEIIALQDHIAGHIMSIYDDNAFELRYGMNKRERAEFLEKIKFLPRPTSQFNFTDTDLISWESL